MSRGDTEGVHDLIAASLEHLAKARHIASTILTLEVIAELGTHHGLPRASVEVLGATAAIRSSMGTHVPPQAAQQLAQLIEPGRRDLGAGFTAAFEHGSTRPTAKLSSTDDRCSPICGRPQSRVGGRGE